jgi:hypothetical protein
MAANAVIESIGVISGVLGVVSFFQSNLPAIHPAGATVQVKAGLGDDTSTDLVRYVCGTVEFVLSNATTSKVRSTMCMVTTSATTSWAKAALAASETLVGPARSLSLRQASRPNIFHFPV